jgi:hypothetical protein
MPRYGVMLCRASPSSVTLPVFHCAIHSADLTSNTLIVSGAVASIRARNIACRPVVRRITSTRHQQGWRIPRVGCETRRPKHTAPNVRRVLRSWLRLRPYQAKRRKNTGMNNTSANFVFVFIASPTSTVSAKICDKHGVAVDFAVGYVEFLTVHGPIKIADSPGGESRHQAWRATHQRLL